MKTTNAAVDLPKFRYLDDIKRYLETMDAELSDSGKLIKQQQKLLAGLFKIDSRQLRAASLSFNITPDDEKRQRSLLRKSKVKIDPEFTKIIVPNIKKLESQYAMAEDLYAKHKAVESIETQLSLSFPNRQGPEYNATVAQIQRMKEKIAEQLKLCFEFLNQVAAEHVPKEFVKYTDLVAELVNEHVIFKEAQQFLYVSVYEGDLMFTSYLMLIDVANDEGEITPHLYISVQWLMSKEPTVTVDLNHEFEVPNKLVGQGDEVGSVGEATKAISSMLEMESFSSALGVVPLALQLKVDPTSINPSLFVYKDFISKVEVTDTSLVFMLRQEADSPEAVAEISAQLYKELKALLRNKAALSMKEGKKGRNSVITFFVRLVAEGGEFNAYDLEFMRDKFGLSNQDLRKIANIINRGAGKGDEKETPQSNNLSELTKRNQEINEKEIKKRLSTKGE